MSVLPENLSWEERAPLALRALYERYGYQKFQMAKFESYDLYRENKNFLPSQAVITFTNAAGKLMALKPDVTMSIVKNAQPEMKTQKLYYNENVYRMRPGSTEYSEIRQIGLEYIGGAGGYAEAETVLLALKSLDIITRDNILCLSHMGLVSAVLAECGLDGERLGPALTALRQKNGPALLDLAATSGLTPEQSRLLTALTDLCGPLAEILPQLRALPLTPAMAAACAELEELCATLACIGWAGRLRLDLTTVGDMDYYNGLIFRGYVKGAPRAVLSGGRYDNLMRRCGKSQSALGFALYLGELDRFFHQPADYDVDALIVCGAASAQTVLHAVNSLITDGMSVRAEREAPPQVRARRVYRLDVNGGLEVAEDA